MTESDKTAEPPFDQGYRLGFADGQRFKAKSYHMSLFKAVFSEKYRREYMRGYKAGYYDAERQRRRAELNKSKAPMRESRERSR